MRRWLMVLMATLLACAGVAEARPFTIEDLLAVESFGRVDIDPSGRWLAFERRGPYIAAPRFDYNTRTSWGLSRLYVVDLKGELRARRAFAIDPGPGVLIGAFSPGGKRLAVYRLAGTRWTLGVLEIASGAVRWLDVTPQEEGTGRALQWLDDDRFVVIARNDGLAPLTVRRGFILAERLPPLWAAAASGAGAHTVLGSGRYLAASRRAPDSDLLRINAASGDAELLASGPFTDLELSPDRRRLALVSTGADLQPLADGPVRGPRGLETEASSVAVLDLGTGEITHPCPDCDALPQLLSWSPSGGSLLILARGGDGLWTSGRLMRLDVAGGGETPVGAGLEFRLDENPVRISTAWMGEEPLVLARARGQTRYDWQRLSAAGAVNLTTGLPAEPDRRLARADAQRLTVVAGGQVWSVSRDGRILTRAAPTVGGAGLGRTGEGARLDRSPAEPLSVSVVSGDDLDLAALTPSGLHVEALSVRDAAVVSAAGRAAAVIVEDADGVERLEVRQVGRPPVTVSTINAGLAQIDGMTSHAVRHRDVDGREVTSWLFLPAHLKGRLPLLVRPYLGASFATAPRDAPGELGFPFNLRLLTGRGYAVLVPSLPKPAGGLVEPSDRLAERILAAVDAAASDKQLEASVDAERLAIVGYSFGGYTVLETLTQTQRFRAGVSLSGLSDFTAAWGGLSPFSAVEPEGGYTPNWRAGGVESTQTRLGRPPWAAPERYRRNSPLYAADRITTPLLLAHGAEDQVPIGQSEAMYAALFRQGKDAQLVTYFGALHTLTSPGDVRDFYARMFAFLDDNLGGPPTSEAPRAVAVGQRN